MPHRLQIVETDTHRVLRNTSDVDCAYVSLVSAVSIWHYPTYDDATVTAAPCIEVRDLPAGHDVEIELVDPHEDGHLAFTLVLAEWADGHVVRTPLGGPPQILPLVYDEKRGGLSRIAAVAQALREGRPIPDSPATPPRVERAIRRIDTLPARVARGLLSDTRLDHHDSAKLSTCTTCIHSVQAVALGLGIRCTHPANNPHHEAGHADHWMVPSRVYVCPVHHTRPDA